VAFVPFFQESHSCWGDSLFRSRVFSNIRAELRTPADFFSYTGRNSTAIAPCCLKPWSTAPVSQACYRASNWIYLGKTQGRGRMDRDHAAHGLAVKDLYVYPLCRNARNRLCCAAPPGFIDGDEAALEPRRPQRPRRNSFHTWSNAESLGEGGTGLFKRLSSLKKQNTDIHRFPQVQIAGNPRPLSLQPPLSQASGTIIDKLLGGAAPA